MAVKLKVVALGNPSKPEEPKKYYARAASSGELTMRQLAENIADGSSLRTTDVMAAIEGLLQEIRKGAKDGKIVRLGDFGSYSMKINSDGYDSPEKVTAKSVKDAKITFRPGKGLSVSPKEINFEKE